MGSVTGESDSTLKMRLTPIFALIILSCLLLNLTSAQRAASRKTTKNNNCRGSSSRPSSSRPSSSRPSSSRGRGSTGGCRPNNQKPTQEEENLENPNSSRNPLRKFKLPKKKSKSTSTSGNSGSSGNPSRKFKLPKKKVKPTPNESSESSTDSGSARKMSKLSNNIKAVFSKVGGQISTKIRSWSRSCTKQSQTTQSRKCQNEAGRSGQKKQKCREAQSARRRSCLEEVFEPTPEDSLQDRNIKAELEELAVQDP